MTNEEKRLANTEYAIIALWNMLSDAIPMDDMKLVGVDTMIGDYFDANESLGADFSSVHINFYKDDGEAEIDRLNMDIGETNADE